MRVYLYCVPRGRCFSLLTSGIPPDFFLILIVVPVMDVLTLSAARPGQANRLTARPHFRGVTGSTCFLTTDL